LIRSCGIRPSLSARLRALLDRTLDAHQADAELVLGHLADATDAAVAQVVDVVHLPEAVADVDQLLEHVEDVATVEHAGAGVASSRRRRRLNFMRPTPERS
jgi:hypothetical protein